MFSIRIFFALAILHIFTSLHSQAIKMDLLGVWRDSSIIGTSAYNNSFNACWGLLVGGKEYGVIGSTQGTHIIDFNQTPPKELFRFNGRERGRNIVHREYYEYKCHLYVVCDEGVKSTLQIIDYSDLPLKATLVYDTNDILANSHDIFVDQEKGFLYASIARTSKFNSIVSVYDIKDPSHPKLIASYKSFDSFKPSHVHAGSAKNDTVIMHCGNEGFVVLDMTDKQKPKILQSFGPGEYPSSGYNHSGWFHPHGRYYCMADETHGFPMKIMDLQSLTNIKFIKEVKAGPNISIAHNPYYTCDYLYVSYYYDGLQVFDSKDPTNPRLAYYYPTSKIPNTDNNYMGAWDAFPFLPSGNILVSDMQDGLFLIKGIEKPCNPIHDCAKINTDISNDKNKKLCQIKLSNDLIYLSTSVSITNYNIIDIYGKIVDSNSLNPMDNNHIISLSNITSGFYILELLDRNKVIQSLKLTLEN